MKSNCPISPNAETELVAQIKVAGEKLMAYWPGGLGQGNPLKIDKKGDGSFVTEADFASNEIVTSTLSRLFPNDSVLSEEVPYTEANANAAKLWILDPLDGTKSFIDGRDDFSILVALAENRQATFGIMYFPAREMLAIGVYGDRSTLNGRQLNVSKSTSLRSECLYLRHLELPNNPAVFKHWMDSGMAFLSLCSGKLDGIIMKLVHHRAWDLAAPAVMIEGSGGTITDEHGRPIKFIGPKMEFEYIVASNGLLHEQLLDLIPK